MDAKKPLSIILSLVLACNTTVLALAEENTPDVGDTSTAIVETESGKENTGSNGIENEEIGDVSGSATGNEANPANPDADNHENGEYSENNKGDAASDNAGGVQDNKGNTADTPSENTPVGSTEPDVPSAKPSASVEKPSATPETPTEGPAPVEQPVEQPVAPAEKEPVITYEKNPDLPEIARYTTADDEGNIEIPEEGLIDFRFPEMVGETTLNTIAAESFMGCQYFKTVTIPAGITSIGDNAFADCQNLQCIILEGRSDDEDLTLGTNWAGNATVLFEEIAVEQPTDETEEQPSTNEGTSQPSDTTNDANAPADNVGGDQTEEPKQDIDNASSGTSKDAENTENTVENEGKANGGTADANVNKGTTDGNSDTTKNDNSADDHKNSDTAYVPKHEDADLPKQADGSGADDAEQE